MPAPGTELYHILHKDRLASVLEQGGLWSDSQVLARGLAGTTIGLDRIKQRRLRSPLWSHPKIMVGDCVPFYFCPRSVMLYLIHKGDQIAYQGGQDPILHLRADRQAVLDWAEAHNKCWAFTDCNAGSSYFRDWCDTQYLNQINWQAVQAKDWQGQMEGKQAEFLLHEFLPWPLISCIGVRSAAVKSQTEALLAGQDHQPLVCVRPDWYY